MKQLYKLLLLAAIAATATAPRASAYDFIADGLAYNINPDGTTVTVTKNSTTPNGSLSIPGSVTHDGKSYTVTVIGDNAFNGCQGYTGTLTIPNTVTSIGFQAFYLCSGFTGTLTIPNMVSHIGDGAFMGCSGFTGTLTLPASITTLGKMAFAGCSGFTGELVIPSSLTSIGNSVFYSCEKLTSVVIPNSVASIDWMAFLGCTKLVDVTCERENPPASNSLAFDYRDDQTLRVPASSINAYKAAEGWKKFRNIEAISGGDPERHTLRGVIELVNPDNATIVYNGKAHRPAVRVIDDTFGELVEGTDYDLEYTNNIKPGIATITATGKWNYTGKLSTTFTITKAPLPDAIATVTVEGNDILYDGEPHPATLKDKTTEGMGKASISYIKEGVAQTDAPVNPGEYTVNVVITEGEYYQGQTIENAASFTIYALDEGDWASMVALYNATNGAKWTKTIDVSDVKHARQLKDKGLATISKGRITALNLSNNALSGELPTKGIALTALSSLNLSSNDLQGNIGAFVAPMTSLTSLDVRWNSLSNVNPPLSKKITSLKLFPQNINEPVLDFDLAKIANDNLLDLLNLLPSVFLYNTETQSFDSNVVLNFYATSSGAPYITSLIIYDNTLIPAFLIGSTNEYRGKSGDKIKVEVYKTSKKSDGNYSHDEERGYTYATLSFPMGDADFNGTVNVNDLQAIINKIFGIYPYRFNWTAANVIADSQLNVQDVVGEVNLLLAAENPEASAPRRTAAIALGDEHTATRRAPVIRNGEEAQAANLYWRDGVLYLSSNTPVSAFDIVLDGEATWLDNGLTLSSNGRHAVAYSLSGTNLPAGTTAIARATSTAPAVRDAALSDADAQPIALTIGNADKTAVNDIRQNALSVGSDNGAISLIASSHLTDVRWAIATIDGRTVAANSGATLQPGNNEMARDLTPGVYVVTVKTHSGNNVQTKVIVR